MIIYLLIIFVFALVLTLWSVRGYGKRPKEEKQESTHRGSIVFQDQKAHHYTHKE